MSPQPKATLISLQATMPLMGMHSFIKLKRLSILPRRVLSPSLYVRVLGSIVEPSRKACQMPRTKVGDHSSGAKAVVDSDRVGGKWRLATGRLVGPTGMAALNTVIREAIAKQDRNAIKL